MKEIYSYPLCDLEKAMVESGLKKFNATQIFQWLYQKNVSEFKEMKNIGKSSIEKLEATFQFNKLKELAVLQDAPGDTIKFLFELNDGQKIETVLMKFNYGYSVCISSQVGCNMGCKFCASGLLKKIRNLETEEMVSQILYVNKFLNEKKQERLSNIVVMGIGEPFDNYENLKKTLQIGTDHNGLGGWEKKILPFPLVGLVNKIMTFATDFPQVNLAVSLHAPNDTIRDQIMPVNHAFPLKQLMDGVKTIWKSNK